MKQRRRFSALATACAVALIAGLAGAVPSQVAHAADEDLECGQSLIQKTLKNGAKWRMCASIHTVKGLVLEKIEFAPASGSREYDGFKRVIDQLYLSQLNVPYDNGDVQYNDITSYGFGSMFLMPQLPELCLGETIDVTQPDVFSSELIDRTIPGICTDEVATGMATHSQESDRADGPRVIGQGTALEVSSMSKIAWYEYQQKMTFDDHGGIDVGLGATGDLALGGPFSTFYSPSPSSGWPVGPPIDGQDYYATSHWHNAIYRVDFGIDSGQSQRVEQWDYAKTGDGLEAPILEGTRTRKDTAFHAIPGDGNDELSWWRVLNEDSQNKDGHARSYEIVNRNPPNEFIPVTQPLVSFTNANPCQEYASQNLNPDCPNQNVLDYVAEDAAPLTDPVAWVNVGFHHIDRDEDQSPMPVHWQRFQLIPRDFFAQSPTITDARQCINGPTTDGIDSTNRPCIAKNTYRPRITAPAGTIQPGTILTASRGIWIENRTTWNYAWMWFRNGEPIVGEDEQGNPVPAIDSTYTVTAADKGKDITVKVTASQVGFGSGTAESLVTTIPGGPTPTPTATTPTPSPTVTTPRPTPTQAPARVASSVSGKLVKSKITVKKNAKVRVTTKARGTTPTGKVQIKYGSKVLKTATLRSGRVTVTLPKFKKARTYSLRVVYLGTSKVKASTSKAFKVRVTKK